VSAASNLEDKIQRRLLEIRTLVPGSIGDMLKLSLIACDEEEKEYTFRSCTEDWMRNIAGTLHGGMCATIVDQTMGIVAFCAKPGEGVAPTIEFQLSYHRPPIPGEDVIVRVRILSVTRSLIRLTAEAALASSPDRLCLTGSGTYLYREK
jgi:uncharacterized protein (TIGR00369 family)